MTTQERINQLAEAALRAAPSSGGIPKPKTFMPSFEKLRSIYPETLDVRTEDSIGRRYYLVRDDWGARICRDGGECLGEVKLTRQDDPQADIPGAP